MSAAGARVTVSTVAIALNAATSSGQTLVLVNRGAATPANDVSLGGSTVTAGNGFALLGAGGTTTIQLSAGEILYAIRDSAADGIVHVLRSGA